MRSEVSVATFLSERSRKNSFRPSSLTRLTAGKQLNGPTGFRGSVPVLTVQPIALGWQFSSCPSSAKCPGYEGKPVEGMKKRLDKPEGKTN